jgi:hypothetical protein
VSREASPPDADIDKLHARLSDGLKACRSMVANYKALLKADPEAEAAPDDPDSVEPDASDPAAPDSA